MREKLVWNLLLLFFSLFCFDLIINYRTCIIDFTLYSASFLLFDLRTRVINFRQKNKTKKNNKITKSSKIKKNAIKTRLTFGYILKEQNKSENESDTHNDIQNTANNIQTLSSKISSLQQLTQSFTYGGPKIIVIPLLFLKVVYVFFIRTSKIFEAFGCT